VDKWGKLGTRADVIFEFFNDPEFYKNQPVIEGAKEFVRKLSQMTEVFVSTSVYPQYMSIRALRIMEEFPEIPLDHIYMGSRKDKIDVDILFDDGMHNVLDSMAAYPILMRRPWNSEATGMLAVNNYDEFLKLVEVIAGSYSIKNTKLAFDKPGVVVLVGPTGSGKNDIASAVCERSESFERLTSYTTARVSKENDRFNHVSVREFHEMQDSGELFEVTNYANHFYGTRYSDVDNILKNGKNVITVMDICGAMAMKTHFDNVIMVYVGKDKKSIISSIIERSASTDEKVKRILAIDNEKHNEQICDFTLSHNDIDKAVEEIVGFLPTLEK
jgi:guanylate kinase